MDFSVLDDEPSAVHAFISKPDFAASVQSEELCTSMALVADTAHQKRDIAVLITFQVHYARARASDYRASKVFESRVPSKGSLCENLSALDLCVAAPLDVLSIIFPRLRAFFFFLCNSMSSPPPLHAI